MKGIVMATLEYCGKRIHFPQSEPIHLDGEADAYADETHQAAFDRLEYVAHQCGYLVSQSVVNGLPVVRVYAGHREFVLTWNHDGWLAKIEYRAARADATTPYKLMWKAV
jgi:hypothetical protein